MADPIVNFFRSTLVGTYSNTDTSFTISTGDGALLPDPSVDGAFNLVIYEGVAGVQANEFEIVRVTGKSGDVLTVSRQQEGTTALTIGSTEHSIILSATKKTFDDKADESITITAGSGLTGGGDLSANRTLNIGEGTGITVSADSISTNDAEIVHDNLSGFVANEHIDHSTVSISAGTGLSGGGDITASRTLSHADTSTLSGAYGGSADGVVIEDITVDALGHVTAVGTVDLDSRFLGISAKASDSDLLDGQDSTYYTNYNNLTNKPTIPTVNNATITLSAGTGLSGGGDFTTDQSSNETITISHADTSSQASVNNSGRTFIQDITLDTYGHVTGITSATDSDTYVGTVTSVATGTGLTGGTITSTGTISHSDTSTLSGAYGGSANGIVIEDITVDGLGHVTAVGTVDLDGRFIQKNVGYEWTGTGANALSFRSADVLETATGDQASLEVFQDTAGADAFMQFHVGGDYAVNFGLKGDINDIAVGGWSMGATYYRVWHAGNDGSGSGLDADTLDGNQATAFYLASNPNGYTTNTGTVTSVGVSAGNGLTGGGTVTTSGTVTLNVGAGTGIDVSADAIAVDVSDFMTNGSNNRVLTATGTDGMNAEANLTFDGSTLSVTGAISSTGDITGNTSDDRLKNKLGRIENAVEKLSLLDGFYYEYNQLANSFGLHDDNRRVGISAQSLMNVLPEAVTRAPFDLDENGNSKSGDNYLTVRYERVVPLLIEAIKELKSEVEKLKS